MNNTQSQYRLARAEISWGQSKVCKRYATLLPDGIFHLIPDHRETLDSCPEQGAVLQIYGYQQFSGLYEINSTKASSARNVRNLRANSLNHLPPQHRS